MNEYQVAHFLWLTVYNYEDNCFIVTIVAFQKWSFPCRGYHESWVSHYSYTSCNV